MSQPDPRQVHNPLENPGSSTQSVQGDSNQPSGSPQPYSASSERLGLITWLFLLFMLVGYAYRSPRIVANEGYQEVPIQATSLMGGAELIGPGHWLSLARYVGGTNGTPSAEEWRILAEVSDISGNETEKKTIVLVVDPGDVPTLQAALAVKDGAPLVYSLYEDRPETPTPDPSATATATPTATSPLFVAPPAIAGQVGLEIPAERIVSGANIAQQTLLSLVIVPKVVVDSEDAIFAAPPFNGCAAYASFLDKNRLVTEKAADAQTVVVWLSAARLAEAAAALTHAERVYLVPDASCELRQTPAATPLLIPTFTPSPTASPTPSPTLSPTTPTG